MTPPEVEYETCAADVMACASSCFEGQNPEACFETARVIQDNTPESDQRPTHSMFAQACATGSAGGCTNRGAGIRNEGLVPRSLPEPPPAGGQTAANLCLHRTFKIACDEGDAWGCAMYGQTFEYGEGAEEDKASALAAYRKSCEIDSEFAACHYVKGRIEEIEKK